MTPNPVSKITDYELIKLTCQLYRKSLFVTLPISIVGAILFDHFIRLQYWLPYLQKNTLIPFGIIGAVLCLPLIPLLWLIQAAIRENQPITLHTFFLIAYQRLLALINCLIAIILMPAIIFALVLLIYLGVWQWLVSIEHVTLLQWLSSPIAFYIIKIIVGIIMLVVITPKSFAPVIIYTDSLDADNAITKSETLIEHHKLSTFMFNLYGILILIFAYLLPDIILSCAKTVVIPHWVNIVASDVLVGLLLPWTTSLWLVQLMRLSQAQSS